MKLLTLLGVLFITTGTWAYSSDCTKGPEYWCRDASTAEDCGAIQHCQQTVWREKENNQQSMTTSETAEMLCTVLVQASTQLLADKSIDVDSIKQYLRRDCTKLPDQNNLIQQCEMAVDLYLSDILRHIQSGTESTKICPIIQRHDTSNAFIPKPKPGGLTSNATCVLCEFVIHLVESAASANASEQELTLILEKICTEMPTVLRVECKGFVDTYAADIIALLVRDIDPAKICELIKICPNSQNVAFLTKPNIQTCGLCDYISTYLSSGYPLENICAHFSTDNNIKQQCEILVYLYKPNICPQLSLCFDDVAPEQPIETIVASLECSVCKYVVTFVDTYIENNRSEAAIEAALEKVCTILPHALNASCVQFVNTFGPILLQLIVKYGSPDKVCDAIQACHNGTEIPETKSLKYIQSEASKKVSPNSFECTLCEFVLGYLDKTIGNNRSTAAVDAVLEQVCKILPASIRDNCTRFVEKYGIVIALLLAQNKTPEQVCDFLKVCHNGTQQITPLKRVQLEAPKKVSPNSFECTLCEFVLGYLDKTLGNNRSTAAVDAVLEQVCKILPASIRENCTHFVEKYGIVIALLLAQNKTPEQVCDFLKVCHNGTQQITPLKRVQLEAPKKVAPNSFECTLCEFVLGYLDKTLGNNRSTAAVDAVLEQVCKILPASIRENCTHFVEKYGIVIALLLAQNKTPEQVCDFLKVCHNGTQQVASQPTNAMFKTKELTANPIECAICKYVVGYVDTIIKNNRSEAAIEAALEKVCTIVPEALNSSCVKFVVTYGPVLVQLLEKYTTPDEVCLALKLCKTATQELTSHDVVQQVPTEQLSLKTVECSICKYVVTFVDTYIGSNRSEAAIEAALEKVCTILPHSLNASCVTFIDTFGPILLQLLEKYVTPDQVCDAIQACHNGTQEIRPMESETSSVNSPQCSLCKLVVSYLDLIIQNNKSEAAIEAALEKICTIVPHAKKAECIQFVNKYGTDLVELPEKLSAPDLVCLALGLCLIDTQSIPPTVTANPVECSLCKYIVGYVDAVIQTNKSEAAIDSALEKVCTILPHSLNHSCVQFVETYGPVLVELLAKYATPSEVCAALKVCANGTQETIPRAAEEVVKTQESYGASLECSVCKYVVTFVDTYIENNKSEAAVEAALEKVCTILPHALNASCVQFVETFGPILLQLIVKYGTPDKVCDAIQLCHNGTEVAEMKLQQNIKSIQGAAECTLCKYVISYINVLIESNATTEEIEKGLTVVCGLLPSTYHKSCANFVTTYGPILPELIAELDDPNVICEWLSLCKKSDDKFIPIPSLKTNKLKSLPCNLCQYLVNYLDAIIQSNSTETKFEEELDKACKILPDKKIQAECQVIVHLFGDDLIKLLVEFGNPKTVCQELGICDK